ncbi:hypothetical protein Tco_1173846 [Tanacetum coccineum]
MNQQTSEDPETITCNCPRYSPKRPQTNPEHREITRTQTDPAQTYSETTAILTQHSNRAIPQPIYNKEPKQLNPRTVAGLNQPRSQFAANPSTKMKNLTARGKRQARSSWVRMEFWNERDEAEPNFKSYGLLTT